jgi:hypothetical protein
MNDKFFGYLDSRRETIWPNSVLCATHNTKENRQKVQRLMMAMNTTAFPVHFEPHEDYPCTLCP